MSNRNVLILKGSPREKGNSSTLAQRAAEGVVKAGATVESISLHSLTIHPCNACDACRRTGKCAINDDMQMLYPKLLAADSLLIASPIYWFWLNAQTKLMIDRWYALETPQGYALSGKRFGLVLTFEDSDPFSSGGVNAIRSFQDMCRYLKVDLAGIVYGSAHKIGDVLSQPDLLEKAFQLGQALGQND
jgi:multimeric flavodoxin WrbA